MPRFTWPSFDRPRQLGHSRRLNQTKDANDEYIMQVQSRCSVYVHETETIISTSSDLRKFAHCRSWIGALCEERFGSESRTLPTCMTQTFSELITTNPTGLSTVGRVTAHTSSCHSAKATLSGCRHEQTKVASGNSQRMTTSSTRTRILSFLQQKPRQAIRAPAAGWRGESAMPIAVRCSSTAPVLEQPQ